MEASDSVNIPVFGSLEFGRVIRALVECTGNKFAGFVDDFDTGPQLLGSNETCRRTHAPAECGTAIAVGYSNLDARWQVYQRVIGDGYECPTLVQPAAYVAASATVGEGCLLMAQSAVDCFATLEDLVVGWTGAVVNHDSVVERNTVLSPSATICGCSRVERNTFIGAGSVIVDHVSVAPASFIKAGSVCSARPKTREQTS